MTWSERMRSRWDSVRSRSGRREPPPPVHKTAFVLAGGGSRGAVQVGMLAELVDRGIRADRVFGASVGAINGAAYAGNPTREGIERMAGIWRDVKGTDIFPRSALDGPWAFLQKRAAVHSNSGLRAIIEAGIDFENLQDTTIPFEVVTTSLTDGRERWIAHGPAVEAILASSAIPSIFPPVVIDGDVLVDGGVVNNVPISRAIGAGCTRIYVLLCGPLALPPAVAQASGRGRADCVLRGRARPFRPRVGVAPAGGRSGCLQRRRRAVGAVPGLLRHQGAHRRRPG